MGMESTVKGSERLTKQRRARRQRLTRKRLFGNTPEGVASTADTGLLQLLIDFLEGKDPKNQAPAHLPSLRSGLTGYPIHVRSSPSPFSRRYSTALSAAGMTGQRSAIPGTHNWPSNWVSVYATSSRAKR